MEFVQGECHRKAALLERVIVPALGPFESGIVVGSGLSWNERRELTDKQIHWMNLRIAPPWNTDSWWLVSATFPLPRSTARLPLPKPSWTWKPPGPAPIAVLAIPPEEDPHRDGVGLNALLPRLEKLVPHFSRVVLAHGLRTEWVTALALQNLMVDLTIPTLDVLAVTPQVTHLFGFDPDIGHLAIRAGKQWESFLHPAEVSVVVHARELASAPWWRQAAESATATPRVCAPEILSNVSQQALL